MEDGGKIFDRFISGIAGSKNPLTGPAKDGIMHFTETWVDYNVKVSDGSTLDPFSQEWVDTVTRR
jgi:hypothetical protein